MGVQRGTLYGALETAMRHLLRGRDVRIEVQEFGEKSDEHDAIEYEVYVLFKEEE